jgi:hypothetical protein
MKIVPPSACSNLPMRVVAAPVNAPRLVAEQLRFEQVGRQRRAVHLHERALAAAGLLVQRARDELLADAALAADEHRDVAVGDLVDHPHDLLHLVVAAPDGAVLVVAELLAQLVQLGHQAALLERALDGGLERDLAEPLRVVRLDDVVGGAELHGLDDRRGALATREHDDLQLGPRGLQVPQGLEAVHAGHHHVEQHDVGGLALPHRGQELVSARVGAGLVTAQRQERAQVRGEAGIVIDDSDERFLHAWFSFSGSSTAMEPSTRPVPVDQTWPPRCSTTRRAIGSARPSPPRNSFSRALGPGSVNSASASSSRAMVSAAIGSPSTTRRSVATTTGPVRSARAAPP